MMHRNLDRRVEALVQVTDRSRDRPDGRLARHASPLRSTSCWMLAPDGWRRSPATGPGRDLQEELLREEPPVASDTPAVRAAGAVLWRPSRKHGVRVAVVHRPRYDDWSLPKGKADPRRNRCR